MKSPLRVAVTGAAGQIAYTLLPRIASGECFGKDQPIILQLLEIPPVLSKLEGVKMEIVDCAPSQLVDVICTDKADVAFADADAVFLVGGLPRGPGMQRADLILKNGPIFQEQGAAIGRVAKRSARTLVVANPCNTNCLVTAANAKGMDAKNFHAMTRLDHNRAVAQLARKSGKTIASVKNMIIWGNHSDTQVPDARFVTLGGLPAVSLLGVEWLHSDDFVKTVGGRGKAIIDARGASSAFSAAHAAMDHMRDWFLGTCCGEHSSMAIPSDGSYGIPVGLYFSYPVKVKDGQVSIVQGLPIDDWTKAKIAATVKELEDERVTVKGLIS